MTRLAHWRRAGGAPASRWLRALVIIVAICAVAACASSHSALHPAGPQAATILEVWRVYFRVSVIVYVIVLIAFFVAIGRAHGRAAPPANEAAVERRSHRLIGAAVALTVIVLIGLALVEFGAARALTSPPEDPLRVTVTGYQWWWQLDYDDPVPANRIRTANELHIPVGRPVELSLAAGDVIHSFWIPSLGGKKDLIPGRDRTHVIQADHEGRYEGQCAEFCGPQHAKMRLFVIAESPDRFAEWQTQQRQPARAPADESERHGQRVFLAGSCALCHAIGGTPAAAVTGPDLTHVGSRATIAAGALPNTAAHLAAWISDPQRIKPGTRMPANTLAPGDLSDIAEYLASLQ